MANYRNPCRRTGVSAVGPLVCEGQENRGRACGKACGIENLVQNSFPQGPIGWVRDVVPGPHKAMSSNQLCNSLDINIVIGVSDLHFFLI